MSDITIKGIDNIIEWIKQNGGTLPKGSRLMFMGRELIPCTVDDHITITREDDTNNE